MPMVPLQFAAQSYSGRTGVADLERLQNLYLESNPNTAKSPVTLYGTPGLRNWSTVGDGPIRGLHKMGSTLYVLTGEDLYTVAHDKTATLVGQIPGVGNVHMCDNGTHVAIATSVDVYACNAGSITPLALPGCVGATYQDGMGIFAIGGGEQFWFTDVDDMLTISGTSFSSADAFADLLVGCISDHRELWLFGETTTEVWYNSGASPVPFVRGQGGFIERGCAAAGSIAKADHRIYLLGDDLAVYCNNGYQLQRISTPAIERLIAAASDPHGAWAFTYRQEGHVFYVLGFSDLTIVYDITSGLWHERVSDTLTRWRANRYARAWDLDIVGDYANGDLYTLDLDYYSDDGDTIQRRAITPPIHSGGQLVSMSRLELDMETGVGLAGGQGSDPQVVVDWSDDGGKTWSNELWVSMGLMGDYTYRGVLNRLGSFRNRSLRLTITDPVKVALLGARANIEARAI